MKISALPAAAPIQPNHRYAVAQGLDTNGAESVDVLRPVARVNLSQRLHLPSLAKQARVTRPMPHVIEIACRPSDACFRAPYKRCYDDLVTFRMVNIADRYHLGLTVKEFWVLEGVTTRFAGEETEQINFFWEALVGITTENGQLPSTFELAQFVGLAADSVATINNANGSGPYHGNIDVVQFNLIVNGGILNGVAVADGTNIINQLTEHDVLFCDQLDFQAIWNLKTPNGTVAAPVDTLHRFAPSSGHAFTWLVNVGYAAAPAVKSTFGHIFMVPFRWANKVQVTSIANAVGAVQDIGQGDGSTLNIGAAKKVLAWNDQRPGHCVEVVLNDAYAPFRRGGVPVVGAPPATIVNSSSQSKLYFTTRENSLDTDVEDQPISLLAYIDGVRANAA